MSSSTDAGARWLRAAGVVALVAVQLAGLWGYRLEEGRAAALARPEAATLMRWRPDTTGIVESHGEQAFTVSAERGLQTIRLGPESVVLARGARATPAVLRPGIPVSVWGAADGARGIAARVILAWVPER
jgi:hypothetical protein